MITNLTEYKRNKQRKARRKIEVYFYKEIKIISVNELEFLNRILINLPIEILQKHVENPQLKISFSSKGVEFLHKQNEEILQKHVENPQLTQDICRNSTENVEIQQPHPIANEPDNSRLPSAFGKSENSENSSSHAGVGGEGGVLLNNNTIRNTGTLSGNSTLYLKEKNIKKRKKKFQEFDEKNEENYTAEFKEFWEAYPRKQKQPETWILWQANEKKLLELFKKIIAAVSLSKNSIYWQDQDGKYIPLPTTYLNNHRWTDHSDKQINAEINKLARLKAKQEQAAQIPTQPQKEPLNSNIAQILEKAGVTKEIWYAMLAEKEGGAKAMGLAANLGLSAPEINTFFEEKKT